MPVNVEVRPEYLHTWTGRLKLIEIVLAFFCIGCCGTAYESTQHWFLLVVVVCLLGTFFFLCYNLCLYTYLKGVGSSWIQNEFYYTVVATFLYFTAFLAQLVTYSGRVKPSEQIWIDAQIAAGVFGLFNFIVYCAGCYIAYSDWKASQAGVSTQPPDI